MIFYYTFYNYQILGPFLKQNLYLKILFANLPEEQGGKLDPLSLEVMKAIEVCNIGGKQTNKRNIKLPMQILMCIS